ncbi:ROK family protein [Sphingobacterium corticibacterium]|uniref:ROK family protein n=1 Tax=Sphingobacterium corticibacterium TaxID=2484746 RepID=A0A4Q6XYB0_9SPHI|nr:ROK family protein [Sphingobacterium corticibacterium]RZF61536.1 ROK family protein [Sphingobacterium corticibacterium]
MDTKERKIIGVDIGGSHIAAGEVVWNERRIRAGSQRRMRVDSHASSETVINAWANFLYHFVDEINKDYVRIGIAMPGPFDYTEGISYIKELNKYDALYGVNVKKELATILGISEEHILFRNDAEAFLQGEVVYRPGLTETKVVGITLGTGLGSAVSDHGACKDVFWAIRPMKEGIAEDYISSRWFMHRYRELSGGQLESVEALAKGQDPWKEQIFSEFATHLAIFLNDFIHAESASTVIIGGNIARCLDLFVDELKTKLDNKQVELYQSALWEDAALLGSGYLWEKELAKSI